MKLLRKISASALALMIVASSASALAVFENNEETLSVEEYAYMDLETALIAIKNDILEARHSMIYCQSWTVDGACSIVCPDGSIEAVPVFYDLFPQDWDIPTAESREMYLSTDTDKVPSVSRALKYYFQGTRRINAATSALATPFCRFTAIDNSDVLGRATRILGAATYNIGFSVDGGADLGYFDNLKAGCGMLCTRCSTNGRNAVRASTYSTSGNADCVLLVHHTRKQQAGEKFEMISGTTGLPGFAGGAFLLQKEKRTDLSATLEILGRDQPDHKLHLTRDAEKLIWQLDHVETELW